MSEVLTPIYRVAKAMAYNPSELGSFGKASGMYIRQFQFPNTYHKSEPLFTRDHDRCAQWDFAHTERCFREHTGSGELRLGTWVQQAWDQKVLAFIKDITQADDRVNWTGYRVLATVDRSSGYVVWMLELFAKSPKHKTQVYTGSSSSCPNIEHQRWPVNSAGYPTYENL